MGTKFTKHVVHAWVLGLCLSGGAAFGADVVLQTPDATEDVRDAIAAASPLVNLDPAQDNDAQDILSAAQADYSRLVTVLYNEGYFAPVVSILINGREAANFAPVSPPSSVRSIVMSVTPGPIFTFGTAQIGPVVPDTEVPGEFASGQTAKVGAIRDAVDVVVTAWRNQGHAVANTGGQQITARHPARKLDATVTIAPGPKLTFGSLIIDGNEDVVTERIRAIADLPTGQVFSPKIVETVATRLRRTGAFRAVAITEADSIGPGDTLDINVKLVEQLPRRLGFGAQISSLEGFGASAFWLHRNLLGGAERLRFDAEINGVGGDSGGVDYRLATRFERPATFNTDTNFYAQASLERLDEVTYKADTFKVEAGIVRIATDRRQYELGLGYVASNAEDDFGKRAFRMFTLPLQATFDYRDNRLDATSGYYLNAELTPFVGVSGTQSGLRAYADARAYYTLGDTRTVTLAARVQLGSLIGPDVGDAFPDYLFYSGGSGTVRGQSYQSLGVTLPTGQNVGGASFVGLSGEVRYKLRDTVGIVGFFDAGYIGETDVGNGPLGAWHTGAGLGLRYNTGIGPIRLDVALPVSGPSANSGVEVYIGIGQAF